MAEFIFLSREFILLYMCRYAEINSTQNYNMKETFIFVKIYVYGREVQDILKFYNDVHVPPGGCRKRDEFIPEMLRENTCSQGLLCNCIGLIICSDENRDLV